MREVKPTQKPVPSSDINDLFFNSGKLDEVITSKQDHYVDRFGANHYTMEGINNLSKRAMSGYGYITKKSFEAGNTISNPNDILLFEKDGIYYRWDGELPKVVNPGSTPDSSGGVGDGKWKAIGKTAKDTINSLSDYGLNQDGIIAARIDFETLGIKTYVPDVEIVVDFESEYKVNHLIGVGRLNWNGRIFDIGLASGYKQLKTVGGRIADMSAGVTVRVGCIGDSTTDGYGTEPFSDNPFTTGSDGKKIPLSTTNHSDNGGVSAWPTKLRTLLRDYHRNQNIEVFNGGYGGTGISSPANSYCWPYKHYEKIFFENEFYAAPQLTIISFGINEAVTTDVKRTQDVINGYRELIYKIKGFGATPVVITPDPLMLTSYSKKSVEEFIPAMKSLCIEEGVTLIDTHKEIRNFWANSEYAWGPYQTDGIHQKTIAHDFKSGVIAKNFMGAVIDVLDDNYISSMEQYAHPLNQQPTRNFQNNKFGVVGNCVSDQEFDFWVYVTGSNFNAVWYDFNANYVNSETMNIADMYSFTVKSSIGYQNAYISKNGRQNYPSSVVYSDSPNLIGKLRYGLNRVTVKMPSSNCANGRYSGYLGVHDKFVMTKSHSYLTKVGKKIYEPAPKTIDNIVSAANVGDLSYISLNLNMDSDTGFIVVEDKTSESTTSVSGWALFRTGGGGNTVRLYGYKQNTFTDLGAVFTDYSDNYPCLVKLEVDESGRKSVKIFDKSGNNVFTSATLETCGHVGGIWGGNATGGNIVKSVKAVVDIVN